MSILFVSRSEWGATEPRSVSRDFTPENGGVIIHHVGGGSNMMHNHVDCVAQVRGIQDGHMNPTFPWQEKYDDIAYNYLVCQHGYAFIGRGLGVRSGANGSNDANQNYYAICGLMGSDDDPHPTLVRVIRELIGHVRIIDGAGKEIKGHQDVFDTECPGNLYPLIRQGEFEPDIGKEPGEPPEKPDEPVVPPWPGVYFRYPPVTQHASVSTWQRQMRARGWNIEVDGIYGEQSQTVCLAFQEEKGLDVDGVVGPATWRAAWTAPVTPPSDDVPSWPGVYLSYPPITEHVSARTWQSKMRERGWTIDVDGLYGEQSRTVCRTFQAEKGLDVDGVVGPVTWNATWTAPITSKT